WIKILQFAANCCIPRQRRPSATPPRPWYGPRFVRGAGTRRKAQAAGLATLLALAAASASVAATGGHGSPDAQQLESRAHAALLDLYSLDAQLADAHTRVAALEAASSRLQRQRALLQ